MYPLIQKDQRNSRRIPAELSVLAHLQDRGVAMKSQNISLDGLFLHCAEFIRPSSGFFAQLWLPDSSQSLQAYLTSCFTEQTWAGYRLGVHISGIAAKDRVTWDAFYHRCLAGQPAERPQSQRSLGHGPRIVAIKDVLSPLACQALRKRGLLVMQVPTVRHALELVHSLPIAAVCSDIRSPEADGLALCHAVSTGRLPTRAVLLTDSKMPKEFLLGLFAGASRVLAKSCSHELLVSCILELLQTPLASECDPLRDHGQVQRAA